ncbi:MAG: ABC transporter substrate-binding protein [Promethearchaeota archaeon]
MKSFQKYSILILLILNLLPFALFKFEPLYNPPRKITEVRNHPISSDVLVGNYTVPGVNVPLNLNDIIRIGILDDLNRPSGIHTKNGALLAAKEINLAGGIEVSGKQYYVGIVAENTDEENPDLDIGKAVSAAYKMVSVHNPHFIIGGYRTESLAAYVEVIMDAKKVFLGTGAGIDYLCQNVLYNYNRYKYWFRITPLNTTSRAKELSNYIIALSAALGAEYNGTVNRVAILREALDWTIPFANALQYNLPLFGLIITTDIAYPITATATDFMTFMNMIKAVEPQILIPLISGTGSIPMNIQYENMKPKCLIAGIDHISEVESNWDDTQGACQYEVMMQNLYRINKTQLTIPFWDAYLNEYNKEPSYTGVGAYDAVRLLTTAVESTQSFDSDIIVTALEDITQTYPFIGASGNIAFTPSHDLVEGWPINTNFFCQWQLDGIKQVVSSYGMIYPNSMATAPLLIPYWGIYDLVEKRALPGDFTLITDAEDPDTDGNIILNWTESLGAESYSLYSSNSPITYINQKLDLITHQYDNSPFEMTNLTTGDYYFIVASYNASGETLSNYIHVNVLLPSTVNFVPGYNLFILIGVLSVAVVIIIEKKWRNLRS